MTVRKRLALVLAITIIAIGVGATQGLAYLRATYGASCAKLDGFPGLLQEMNLLAQGDCKVNNGKIKSCANENSTCTIKAPSRGAPGSPGMCQTVSNVCTCVPN